MVTVLNYKNLKYYMCINTLNIPTYNIKVKYNDFN